MTYRPARGSIAEVVVASLRVGELRTGSITSRNRDQQWTLTQVGNWEIDKVDLKGDGDFVDASELNDDRTHNVVNELTARDTDDNGTDNFTFTYDAAGNLTDDGESYTYEWDPFYRLRKIKNRSTAALVAEYKYNGLGYRISIHEDTDSDQDVDANDKWFHHAYDERWRWAATYRESDSSPKEEFLHHAAGLGGNGGGSYIDLVVYRDLDANTAWTSAADGTMEERIDYCQNWRADVSVIVSETGGMMEWAKYSAYGVPFGLPGGDTDSDGDCDATDVTVAARGIRATCSSAKRSQPSSAKLRLSIAPTPAPRAPAAARPPHRPPGCAALPRARSRPDPALPPPEPRARKTLQRSDGLDQAAPPHAAASKPSSPASPPARPSAATTPEGSGPAAPGGPASAASALVAPCPRSSRMRPRGPGGAPVTLALD